MSQVAGSGAGTGNGPDEDSAKGGVRYWAATSLLDFLAVAFSGLRWSAFSRSLRPFVVHFDKSLAGMPAIVRLDAIDDSELEEVDVVLEDFEVVPEAAPVEDDAAFP